MDCRNVFVRRYQKMPHLRAEPDKTDSKLANAEPGRVAKSLAQPQQAGERSKKM